jgi:hypothetical protein
MLDLFPGFWSLWSPCEHFGFSIGDLGTQSEWKGKYKERRCPHHRYRGPAEHNFSVQRQINVVARSWATGLLKG